ncbi:MAG: hypothetical protein IT435_03790 [Phycisphaerales bacterium]|nr:hypothetical protein [Phycisphaerales bacterium]
MKCNAAPTIEFKFHFERSRRGQKRVVVGERPSRSALPPGRLPRVTRLMALAIRFDQLIRDGEVSDLAEIARLGHVTRARVTQIMNMLHLAPDIQEQLLLQGGVDRGKDPITERHMRAVSSLIDWRKQRALWKSIVINGSQPGQANVDIGPI